MASQQLIVVIPCMKGGFLNILVVNRYLMVPKLQVNLGKDLGSSYMIEQVIDPREWVSVLDGHFVKLTVIDPHPHSTILILYEKY